MMRQNEAVSLDLLSGEEIRRMNPDKQPRVDNFNKKKWLIIILASFAFLGILLGFVAIADFHGSDEKVPPVSQVSTTDTSVCVVSIDNLNSPLVCYNAHTEVPKGDYRMVSHSSTHACALATSGRLICWGDVCPSAESGCPARFTDFTDATFQEVVVTSHSTCLLSTNGTVSCHGRFTVPNELTGQVVVDISALDGVACALTLDSTAYCWDKKGDLFDLSIPDGEAVVQIATGSTPSVFENLNDDQIDDRRRADDVTAPDKTACFVSFTGRVYCKDLEPDELGLEPDWVRMLSGSDSEFEYVSFSDGRGCAITTEGAIECFTFGIHVEPLADQPSGFQYLQFIDVSVSRHAACAVSTDYQFYCWDDYFTMGTFDFAKPPKNAERAAASSLAPPPPVNGSGTTVSPPTNGIPFFARQPCPHGKRRLADGSCFDVDECSSNLFDCPESSYCVNTDGSYECPCYPGYQKMNNGMCADVDECALGTDNCHADATCVNWKGQYWCVCNTGYAGSGITCSDVDECTDDLHNCDENASCSNTIGSFDCDCNAGWTGGPNNGTHCEDVNECVLGEDDCDPNASCADTVGSFTCTCNAGFDGNGTFCDADQCLTTPCDVNADCTDTVPGFECTCVDGWVGDGFTCSDENECDTGNDNCHEHASCSNNVGSFDCTCDTHYVGDGVHCDLNECSSGDDNCHAQASCTNLDPGFSCSCNAGWAGNGTYCSDEDECDLGTETCRANSYCVNTVGSYNCPCLGTYDDDGTNCNDIDECAEDLDNCPIDSSCVNNDGFFSCDCDDNTKQFVFPDTPTNFIGLTRASGLPIFIPIGQNASGYSASIIWCDNHNCDSNTIFDIPEFYDEEPDANILSTDVVVIAGRRVNSQVLLYRYCADVGCSDTNTIQVDSAGYGTGVTVDSNDDVVILTSSLSQLKIMRCYSHQCDWANRHVNVTNNIQSNYLKMALNDNDLPVISHLDSAYLGVFTCVDALCTNFTSSDYTLQDNGYMSDIAVRRDGRPVIVWRDQNADRLMFGSCTTPACDTLEVTDLAKGGYFPTIDLRPKSWVEPEDHPVITHLRSVTSTRRVDLLTCQDPECEDVDTATLQATGFGNANAVYYNPVSNYMYTMESFGTKSGWKLIKYCIDH